MGNNGVLLIGGWLLAVCNLAMSAAAVGAEPADGRPTAAAATQRDTEAEEWVRFQLQGDPQGLAQWNAKSDAERATTIQQLRAVYTELGVPMSTVRGLDPKALAEEQDQAQFFGAQLQALRSARMRLASMSEQDHRRILDSCIDLLLHNERRRQRYIGKQIPAGLAFVNPAALDLFAQQTCTVYLQKGMGQGLGLEVRQVDGTWTLSRFDEYDSWQRVPIALP